MLFAREENLDPTRDRAHAGSADPSTEEHTIDPDFQRFMARRLSEMKASGLPGMAQSDTITGW
jgi:hypothetical protein